MGYRPDELDRKLIVATQGGLPLSPMPYADIAAQLGIDEAEVLKRMQNLLDNGVIRRIGVVPNHYALGYRANGMSVWDVDDDAIAVLGPRIGTLEFVTHCYRRPRRPPAWRYNLFAMVHARTREEVEGRLAVIAGLLGDACRAHEVLYSERILKKAGLRFG